MHNDEAELEGEAVREPGFRVLNWIAIIEQLSTTLANHTLAPAGLALPQFILLNQFSHRPEEGRTITAIARALQRPQPGVSKTVAKLIERGYLAWQANPADGRSKLLMLSAAGRRAHARAVGLLGAEMAAALAGWNKAEVQALFDQLDRLKIWFDDNRPEPRQTP